VERDYHRLIPSGSPFPLLTFSGTYVLKEEMMHRPGTRDDRTSLGILVDSWYGRLIEAVSGRPAHLSHSLQVFQGLHRIDGQRQASGVGRNHRPGNRVPLERDGRKAEGLGMITAEIVSLQDIPALGNGYSSGDVFFKPKYASEGLPLYFRGRIGAGPGWPLTLIRLRKLLAPRQELPNGSSLHDFLSTRLPNSRCLWPQFR
jgi:hypothetical protein